MASAVCVGDPLNLDLRNGNSQSVRRVGAKDRAASKADGARKSDAPPCPQSPRVISPRVPPKAPAPQYPFHKVHQFLCRNPRLLDDMAAMRLVCEKISGFVRENASISTSPNLQFTTADNLDRVSDVASELANKMKCCIEAQKVQASDKRTQAQNESMAQLQLYLLQTFKILLRKQSNRMELGHRGVRALGSLVSCAKRNEIACEGANALLNMCYEPSNVGILVDEIGVGFLVDFLSSNDVALQASSAGAIQSICYQYIGRAAARDHDVIEKLAKLLHSENLGVQTRSVSALHNISSDPISIRSIREAGCLPLLVDLLRSASPEACTSAAGTIQNVSREPLSRRILLDSKAAEPLSDLLFGSDVQGQACAAGALLNILGPDVNQEGGQEVASSARASFRRLLADSVAIGAIWQSIFESEM